jgi:deoxyribodipyrimidine photolyase-related protein
MIFLIFPNQLFEQSKSFLSSYDEIILLEHDIGFGGKNAVVPEFHIKRLCFIRAAMQAYHQELKKLHHKITYIPHGKWQSYFKSLAKSSIPITTYHPNDLHLQSNLESLTKLHKDRLTYLDHPGWILTDKEVVEMMGSAPYKNYVFYQKMREKFQILMTKSGKPVGGVLRFDQENRLKIPKNEINKIPKTQQYSIPDDIIISIKKDFPHALSPESLKNPSIIFPFERADYLPLVKLFIKEKLDKFGPFEDSICDENVPNGATNYHMVISGGLNLGLITPMEIINLVIKVASKHPIASVEGLIAQILGWREYMRGLYLVIPSKNWKLNPFHHTHKLHDNWYQATTGIKPLDVVISRTLENGYNHHIERLMVIGSMMFMCEVEPSEVLKWFNEMYLDSWDWVMMGNVLYMSQYIEPNVATTKPYFSSSNYILKMSNFANDPEWTEKWDALYWNTVDRIRDTLKRNYRMAAQVSFYNKKLEGEKEEIKKITRDAFKNLVK